MRRDDNKVGVSLGGVYKMAMNMKLRVELWHIIINTINIIMDDSSPLAMQFREFDTDGDNKLNPDEVYELLKLLGKNIYKGSVSSVCYSSLLRQPRCSTMLTRTHRIHCSHSHNSSSSSSPWKTQSSTTSGRENTKS